jgi:hypothetical protein
MIENTSDRDPLIHIAGMWGSNHGSRYIQEMEAAGQSQFVHSDRMPVDAPIDKLEALGFTFGDPDPADPLFRPATLPAGWSRQGSDHDMWSYIVDDKGRRRVSVFYKAAYYDRAAHASIVSPAAALADAMFADAEPTAVTLDDLLTADIARAYLVDALTAASLSFRPTADRVARIEKLRALVDEAAAGVADRG